jgi:26S proteasome regulatory subunit N7
MTEKETESIVPDFNLSDKVFLVQHSNNVNETLIEEIIKAIQVQNMAPYYHYLYYDLKLNGLEWDQSLYDSIVAENNKHISEIKNEIERLDKEDESEMDILKKWTELGEYYAIIGDKVNAETTLLKTIELAPSTGLKIDLYLLISRIGYFYNDLIFIKKYLDKSNELIEKGGDWERRNRFKTYNGIYLMSIRNFKEASKLLNESLSTFTSTELTTYENVAKYSLICGSIIFERPDLKNKLIENPEILSINSTTDKLLPIYKLVKSLYSTEYKKFFPSLLETNDLILIKDKYLYEHSNYYLREIRCRAYSQLLESYRSLSLKSMASSFGVSIEFLDFDLCKFIPNKKLNCVIDRVEGIVQTNRSDTKNAQYNALIKSGDALLTKLQKYGAAVRLSGAEKV